ncbi:MAG: hypothetical protein ABEI80_06540 [Haloplanus sp.]
MGPPLASASVRSTAARIRALVRGAAFWAAVLLPFAAVAALALGGSLGTVGPLLACNVAALVLGHGYRPAGDRRQRTYNQL